MSKNASSFQDAALVIPSAVEESGTPGAGQGAWGKSFVLLTAGVSLSIRYAELTRIGRLGAVR